MNRDLLKQQRGISEFEIRRLYREGVVQRDEKGYFAYETLEPWENGEWGQKFYIEDTYQYLEDRICHLYQQGSKLKKAFEEKDPRKHFSEIQYIIFQLLFTDIELVLLHSLHQGWELEGLFSVRQAQQWLESQLESRSFHELFNEVLASQTETPLGTMRNFCRVMGDLLEDAHYTYTTPHAPLNQVIGGIF